MISVNLPYSRSHFSWTFCPIPIFTQYLNLCNSYCFSPFMFPNYFHAGTLDLICYLLSNIIFSASVSIPFKLPFDLIWYLLPFTWMLSCCHISIFKFFFFNLVDHSFFAVPLQRFYSSSLSFPFLLHHCYSCHQENLLIPFPCWFILVSLPFPLYYELVPYGHCCLAYLVYAISLSPTIIIIGKLWIRILPMVTGE